MENTLDTRSYSELKTAKSIAQHTVYNRYQPQIHEYQTVPDFFS